MGGQFAVIRPRPHYEDLIGQDRLPPWLSDPAASSRPAARKIGAA